jgi:hypothetical protein
MHNNTLRDIKAIIYRDAHPDEETPNTRQQTHRSRCDLLIKEIEDLIAQNEKIADLVAVAFNLGSREQFEINGNDCVPYVGEALKLLQSRNCIDSETVTIFKSKPKD